MPSPLTLSLSRSSSEHLSALPLNYQASIYSSRSRLHVPLQNTSREHLLRPVKKSKGLDRRYTDIARACRIRIASGAADAIKIERRKSYGIGGAGNIRRPSETMYSDRVNSGGPRRASVWSTMSSSPPPEGRRASIMSLFRRSTMIEDSERPTVEVRESNSGRK